MPCKFIDYNIFTWLMYAYFHLLILFSCKDNDAKNNVAREIQHFNHASTNVLLPKNFAFSWRKPMLQIYNQLQKYLRQCTLFWLNGLSMILCLSYPPSPLIKIASNKRSWSLVWLAAIWNKKGWFFIGVSQHFCNWF